MPRFNHAYDIAFELVTEHDKDQVTAEELRAALWARLKSMDDTEILEACGYPFNSYEMEAE